MYKDLKELKKLAEQIVLFDEEQRAKAVEWKPMEPSIPKDYKLQELREQTKIQENTLDEQKRQSDIMDLWAMMMEKQAGILQKQEVENKKSQRINYILTFIFGVATLAQTYFAYLDYKKSTMLNPPSAIEQSKN